MSTPVDYEFLSNSTDYFGVNGDQNK